MFNVSALIAAGWHIQVGDVTDQWRD